MKCRFCGEMYKLTVFHKDTTACLDCSGVTEDMSIEDDEMKIDLWVLKHPSGKTTPVFPCEDPTDNEEYTRK